ncbi:alpha/beta hydrolase family protein [Flagellimonas nanhaiensis]|uniref:Alpha/beta hydrolase n=1 Tax=Flagellimonas nanhaiensis TaxID=2292706 RepID=A0A371JNH1_9FLAO|nr:alpha/beta hydrolase [Allomuricauda nanhaiensis]RDY58720.1 alpha/beta hydrolase [Allomuricauda nanhaiensis]
MRYSLISVILLGFFISCSKEDDSIPSDQIERQGIFTTQVENGSIEGELFLPDGNGPFPTMIIVPGSGEETKAGLTNFVSLFNSFGYGLYIYDKRGLGNSTGSYPIEIPENPLEFLSARADDVISIVELLKTHGLIDTNKIGLFGSSQGTWVNTIAYDKIGKDIGLMVMASGGATSTGIEQHYENLIEQSNYSIEDANEALNEYDGPLGYDPKPTLTETDVPTLFILGGKDQSHPTLYDKALIEGMQKSKFTIHFYENADHDLLDIDTQAYPSMLLQNLENWLNDNK